MKRISLLLALITAPLIGQSGGALVGLITDSTGAAVKNARIVLLEVNAGTRREATTNNLGIYAFSLLPAGEYRLEAIKAGLTPLHIERVVLGVNEKRSLRLQWEATYEQRSAMGR